MSVQTRDFSVESLAAGYMNFIRYLMESYPVTLTMESLCAVHDAAGMQWWAVIAFGTFTMRAALMFPAHVISQKVQT